jgi:hypothetical protein
MHAMRRQRFDVGLQPGAATWIMSGQAQDTGLGGCIEVDRTA